MKPEKEIQRAHDLFAGIFVGDVPSPFPKVRLAKFEEWLNAQPTEVQEMIQFQIMVQESAVLCWVLNHDHARSFGENLAKVEAWLLDNHGLVLEDHSN